MLPLRPSERVRPSPTVPSWQTSQASYSRAVSPASVGSAPFERESCPRAAVRSRRTLWRVEKLPTVDCVVCRTATVPPGDASKERRSPPTTRIRTRRNYTSFLYSCGSPSSYLVFSALGAGGHHDDWTLIRQRQRQRSEPVRHGRLIRGG